MIKRICDNCGKDITAEGYKNYHRKKDNILCVECHVAFYKDKKAIEDKFYEDIDKLIQTYSEGKGRNGCKEEVKL